jgi:hypothetical protein
MMDKIERVLALKGYRKLTAYLVGTGLLVGGVIDQSTWLALSLVYIGIQGATDIADNIKRKRNDVTL